MEAKVFYFETSEKDNTDVTMNLARQRAEELKIRQVVVASMHGYTAKRAKEIFYDMDEVEIIAVSVSASFEKEGWTITSDEREELERLGIKVLTSVHAFGNDVNDALGIRTPNYIVGEALSRFCQGMKVAVEIAIMASDAGLLDTNDEVISIAGTSGGADTALVLKPAYARKFKELEIREILAKPRNVDQNLIRGK